MKIFKKILLALSFTIIIFTTIIFKYNINCMGDTQSGYGHFFVWLTRGYTSLSYQVDLIKLIFDFIIFFSTIFSVIEFLNYNLNKLLTTITYLVAVFIFLALASVTILFEIYFAEINCEIIFRNISFGW